ncbi:MAG TPA: polysaccharide biosynthesis/export family protein [Rhizobiaceae bacterium]
MAFGMAAMALPAMGQPGSPRMTPETKLRVSVAQWMPTKGQYEQWTALGGEFVVTQDGELVLPVVGSVPVGELDPAGLASEIAGRLQSTMGLASAPVTTVEVVEYPPIYVVGDVESPGEYRFRSGLTALQALALGGGIHRDVDAGKNSETQIRLAGELRGIAADTMRSKARIARLEAEMSGAAEFSTPDDGVGSHDEAMAEIAAQEKVLFLARAKEIERQTKSLSDLRELFGAEIDVLKQKVKASDESIKTAEEEMAAVSVLVDKGIAVASRKSDLQRTLSGYRADRLDQITAMMRARQGVAEATRNIEGLRDRHQTEVAAELQNERATLEQLRLKEEVSRKMLFEALGSAEVSEGPAADRPLAFAIVRRQGGEPRESPAFETTPLEPGDVVKVKLSAMTRRSASSSFGPLAQR